MPRTARSEILAKQVGEAVRSARRQASLTQAQVAERLGVSPPYVANVEAGRENITLGQLANIAAALGAGLDVSFPLPDRERVTVPDARASR
ncbi:MAG: helix-turn-helix domain-containing protein [Actinomycetota bacterium]|nr:helix-turn-helix domain-containing protein [Actinomycetota bacterium]